MGVGAEIDRHALDAGREVRAVVEIEAAQVILVSLAPAGVGGDDHARHGLQDFGGAQDRPP